MFFAETTPNKIVNIKGVDCGQPTANNNIVMFSNPTHLGCWGDGSDNMIIAEHENKMTASEEEESMNENQNEWK